MKALTAKLLHYGALVSVTILAIVVMWWLSAKTQQQSAPRGQLRQLATVAAPKAPVAVEPVQVKMCEITSTHAGKISAWETYLVGFEVPGRVHVLGENAAGRPLDEGDRVEAGQVLAMLDDRAYRARRSEAAARVEQATSDVQRGERVRESNPAALSEAEMQRLVTELALARAQYEVATKALDDATLRAPVSGTLSRRMIKGGESVSANQVVFELVEDDRMLLVVDVPESQIRELQQRERYVKRNQAEEDPRGDPENRVFRAHVHLEGRDSFGNAWPSLDGEVRRIPVVADQRTGLFAVEIALANDDRHLRPGMVATADIVVNRLPGYEIPEVAVIHRARSAHLFTVERERAEMEMLYWNLGSADLVRARQVDLPQWVDQGPHVVVPASEVELDSVVVRGQFRLADGQLVRVVDEMESWRDRTVTTSVSQGPTDTVIHQRGQQ